jgi:hypothetical protein
MHLLRVAVVFCADHASHLNDEPLDAEAASITTNITEETLNSQSRYKLDRPVWRMRFTAAGFSSSVEIATTHGAIDHEPSWPTVPSLQPARLATV